MFLFYFIFFTFLRFLKFFIFSRTFLHLCWKVHSVRYNSVAIFIRLAVVASQIDEIHTKFSENSSCSRTSKVIDFYVSQKRM